MAKCEPSKCLWVKVAQKSSDHFEAQAFKRSWQLMVMLASHIRDVEAVGARRWRGDAHHRATHFQEAYLQLCAQVPKLTILDEEEAFLARFNRTIAAYGRRV